MVFKNWEYGIQKLGIWYSKTGNMVFKNWEYGIQKLGIWY